jgi:spore germination cell wall hydrolase CwlJ-like protein
MPFIGLILGYFGITTFFKNGGGLTLPDGKAPQDQNIFFGLFDFLKREAEEPKINDQVDIMARTMWGEARNEGYKGMQAVANVIMNRVASKRWPDTPKAVALQRLQFSAWNSNDPNRALMEKVTTQDSRFKMAVDIAYKAYTGQIRDVTNGADHYLNVAVTRQIRGGTLPSWVDFNKKTADIGRHTFLRLA